MGYDTFHHFPSVTVLPLLVVEVGGASVSGDVLTFLKPQFAEKRKIKLSFNAV